VQKTKQFGFRNLLNLEFRIFKFSDNFIYLLDIQLYKLPRLFRAWI